MASAHDVAKYFIIQMDDNAGDLISNLKLQKLVYYAQGFHLALFDRPLFDEEIEAWMHGPVVPDLYQTYKEYGPKSIPAPVDFDIKSIDSETREFLDEVFQVFGQFSAWKLRNMTHREPPWKDNADYCGIISHEEMANYFKTLVKQ